MATEAASAPRFRLVVLYGLAGAGKLTVAQRLHSLTKDADPSTQNVQVFHNHLVVDSLLALFPFASEPFKTLRSKWWLEAFKAAYDQATEAPAADGAPATTTTVLFTFVFESTVAKGFMHDVASTVVPEGAGKSTSELVFVELACDEEVTYARLTEPSREAYGKAKDPAIIRAAMARGDIFVPAVSDLPAGHTYHRFDTTSVSAADTAAAIAGALGLAAERASGTAVA